MSQDALHSAIQTIRTQIQAELEAQLAAIERQHQDAVDLARTQAREEAEARVAQAAAEADRRVAAETTAARSEAEQKAAESLEQARREAAQQQEQSRVELEQVRAELESARGELERSREELERTRQELERTREELERSRKDALQGLETERSGRAAAEHAHAARLAELERDIERASQRADALDTELTALRGRHGAAEAAAREQLDAERQSLESKLAAARDRETESRAAERQSQLAAAERLLNAVRAIGESRSLSDVLTALANGAAAEASRALVLVPADDGLQPFRAKGFDPDQIRGRQADTRDDVLRSAMRDGKAVSVTAGAAPSFAALADDRAGIAVPVTVGGHAVAVLYADNGLGASPEFPASWPEAVQILCHHASAAVSHLTAVRTTQAMRLMRPPAAASSSRPAAGDTDADQSARRYARLLVSEIKLYNESAVRIGREKRDLLARLRPEIERARRLYEERVPGTVVKREQYFEHELRQTLAGGDASLLGQQTVFP